jgi:ubiquinone/menaquinone biosynthesis C-methylase UbiE
MSLARQYDDWHQRVFDSDPDREDEETPWYRLVLEYLGPLSGKRVLEVACGRGGFASRIASMGAVAFGADFSGTALRIARKGMSHSGAGARLQLTQADAQKLPFADESFDIVVSCETIEHVPNPVSALKEMSRVCRANGSLYLTTPNYFNAMGLYLIYARARHGRRSSKWAQPLDHVFLFPRVRRMLRRAGWEIIHSDGTVHAFPIRPGHNPVELPSLESNRAVRRILSPFAYHYFVMAHKRDARYAGERPSDNS